MNIPHSLRNNWVPCLWYSLQKPTLFRILWSSPAPNLLKLLPVSKLNNNCIFILMEALTMNIAKYYFSVPKIKLTVPDSALWVQNLPNERRLKNDNNMLVTKLKTINHCCLAILSNVCDLWRSLSHHHHLLIYFQALYIDTDILL